MVEWWAWVLVVIGILIFLIDGFYASRRFKRGEYGWYRSGWDGANAKAHCFLFTARARGGATIEPVAIPYEYQTPTARPMMSRRTAFIFAGG